MTTEEVIELKARISRVEKLVILAIISNIPQFLEMIQNF